MAEITLHVGTYTKNGGRGLVPLTLTADGALTPGEPFVDAANASFAARGHGLAYLVDEQDEGAINVLRQGANGWQRLARRLTRGAAPCYVALDRHGSRLAVANYASGSVALYALDEHGIPLDPPALFQSEGSGPVKGRQGGPHAHCVRFSHGGEGLYLVDLGADRVDCLKLGKGAVFLEAEEAWRAPPGTGPRHLLFHPRRPLAVVLAELASTLTLLEVRFGKLLPRQALATQPSEFEGENLGGHLALGREGTRVYVSNRGHDSLAVFALENDRLELLQHVSSGGAHPRHFALLEDAGKLVVAHERDGRVVLFDLTTDGRLVATGQSVQIPGACFVLT